MTCANEADKAAADCEDDCCEECWWRMLECPCREKGALIWCIIVPPRETREAGLRALEDFASGEGRSISSVTFISVCLLLRDLLLKRLCIRHRSVSASASLPGNGQQ